MVELQAIVKEFPKVTKDPHKFAVEFNTVIQTYRPGFSDFYQLVHMLVGEGQATQWMTLLMGTSLTEFRKTNP